MPANYSDMLAAAERLEAPYDFVRIRADPYETNGVVVFGELTVYPAGGLKRMDPRLDFELGQAWSLPTG